MKKLLTILTLLILCVPVSAANRLTTWSSGQVLTHTALNSEFDNIYIGDISRTAGYWGSNDNIPVDFGTAQDAQLEWDTVQTQDSLWLGLSGSMTFIITDKADAATDYGIAASTDPLLIIHSADATVAGDYIALSHNQTDSVINTGAGGFSIQAAGTEITDVTSVGDWVFKGTTPTLTVGDAGAEDTAVLFDGNALDFHVALDDSADDLVIGTGATIGSGTILTLDGGTSLVTAAAGLTVTGATLLNGASTIGDAVDDTITMTGSIQGTNALIFEGSTVDGIETIFAIADPSAIDKTITFPQTTGTVAMYDVATIWSGTFQTTSTTQIGDNVTDDLTITSAVQGANAIYFDGATDDTVETILAITDPTSSDKTITLPNATGTVALIGYGAQTGTLDVATIDASSSIMLGGLNINTSGVLTNVAYEGQANIFTADQEINGTTPLLTIGDAGAEDAGIVFDGPSTADGHIGYDGATGDIILGGGTTIGNEDFITLDLSANDVIIDQETIINDDLTVQGTIPNIIVGDEGAEDAYIQIEGAAGYQIGLGYDHSGTTLVLSVGSAFGSTPLMRFDYTNGVEIVGDKLEINGVTYSWPATDGNAGEVLKTDGAGNLDWVAN